MEKEKLLEVLRACFAQDTCYPPMQALWTPDNPSCGQCAVASLVVQDYLGGWIVGDPDLHHYWNILPASEDFDTTRDQFRNGENPLAKTVSTRMRLLTGPGSKEAQTFARYFLLAFRVWNKTKEMPPFPWARELGIYCQQQPEE